MLQFSRWKIIAIIASVVLSIFVALPNLLPAAVNEQLKPYNLKPITLGLDLQGGSNLLYEVDRKDLLDRLAKQVTGDIRAGLREAKIGYSGINRSENGVSVRITKPEDLDRAKTELAKLLQPLDAGIFSTGLPVNLLDLASQDQQFFLNFSEHGINTKIANSVDQIIKIIGNRLDATGIAEITIVQQGKDRINIQIPGRDIKPTIEPGKLTFQLVCESQPTANGQQPPPECASLAQKDSPQEMWVQISSRATVDGADLVDARPGFDQTNQPVVTFRFNLKGAERFARLTRENVGKPFAIILDDKIISAPNINEPITGGSGQISGNFTSDETASLSIVLRSGALPAQLIVVEERTVGPSLGSDSVRAGVIASLVGLVGIMIFIMLPYGLFGIFANLALMANLVMLIAIMSFFGFTLTLPGIAGIVLTLGMAIDSNVLVFERIREEWRNGRTAYNAVETGFKEALATVVDANVTTLIAAAVLFGIGSGPVRGFAVTLAIGIFTTMFTAFTLTRLVVALWVLRTKPKEIPL